MADETPQNELTPTTPDPTFMVDESTKEFFDTYVGPGKKYPNVGELAKAYANADTHIGALTRDAGKYKTEADSLKELLMENLVNPKPNEETPNPNPKPTEETPQHQPAEQQTPPKDDKEPVDVKALVKAALEEVSVEDRRKKNAETTQEATIRHFGDQDSAVKALEEKANELGVSAQWIANLAFESPKAYFATMGINPESPPKSTNTPAPRSDVNPQRLADTNQGTKPNTYQFYQELRRTDPARYRSQAVQQAILKDAANNPNFYS